MKFVNVIITKNNRIIENYLFNDPGKAEQKFVEICEEHSLFQMLWDTLNVDAKANILVAGYYEGFSNAVVFISFPEVPVVA